jgi:hypothetical protein
MFAIMILAATLSHPPGGEEPTVMTEASGTVDAAGEGCMGIDGLMSGDEVSVEILVTGTDTGNATVTNTTTGDTATCEIGFIQREKNKLPANILCIGIKDSNIEGLADNDRLEIAIDFATYNQLTVINGNTMDCVNITMNSLNTG